MACDLWDGERVDRVFSPCRRCGRPWSSHIANQLAAPVLVLDDNDSPTVVVVQNDLIRYLFSDDDPSEQEWRPAPRTRHPVTGRFMAGDCERDCLEHCAGLCGSGS